MKYFYTTVVAAALLWGSFHIGHWYALDNMSDSVSFNDGTLTCKHIEIAYTAQRAEIVAALQQTAFNVEQYGCSNIFFTN